MSLTKNGDIKYELKKTWKNGVTHVVLSPHELIKKLCALIPQPRMHLVRYSGVLAPNAKMRPGVIPGLTRAQIKAKEEKNKDPDEKTPIKKSSWATLLARVFDIDISNKRAIISFAAWGVLIPSDTNIAPNSTIGIMSERVIVCASLSCC